MKTITLTLIVSFLLCNTSVTAQSLSGKLSVSGFKTGAIIKENAPVQLFKSFKDNKYKIGFSFTAKGLDEEGIILFDMKTTVRKNGKTIGSATRSGWPWLPGDMFVPVEAFDFIPILQKEVPRKSIVGKGKPISGNYEITIEMKPSSGQDVSGSVREETFSFQLQ